MRTRTVLLLHAVIPAVTATAAATLKSGCWELTADRHEIRLSPRPRPLCPDCKGEGGWWAEGPDPGRELCWCWDRPTRGLQLLPAHDRWADEPPI